MDSTQFDRLSISLSNRLSRRRALAVGTTALGAAVLARTADARAQDATPAAVDLPDSSPGFLYIQLADRGTWTAKPGDDGLFELALYGISEQTLYFATGSDRIVGTMATAEILDEIGFTPADPPNAAIEVRTADGSRDVLVVQLIDPVYSRGYGAEPEDVLIYNARVLRAYSGERLTEWLPDIDDDQLPKAFTSASLFIDYSCIPLEGCYRLDEAGNVETRVAGLPAGRARQLPDVLGRCSPCCGNSFVNLANVCNAVYAECQERCIPG